VRLLSFFNKIEKQLFFNEAEIFINISNYKSLKEIIDFCEKDFQKINKVKPLNLDKKLAVINFFNYFIS
jgi:hypothetical protein